MAAFVKFEAFVEAIAEKKHDLGADTFFIQLLATIPDGAADAVEIDLPADLSTANGYTSGGGLGRNRYSFGSDQWNL